ncbi:MAG: YciI family protein [Caulobacter sp.]|nr:YciI family protein [Caulobacter sp.]
MQYMLLIYEPESAYKGEAGQASLIEIVGKHMALSAQMREAGVMVSGDGLQGADTATTVSTGPGGAQTLHDGPFAETREQLGGYYLIEADDLDAALGWARRIPVIEGGKVEVRPVMTY